jgi:predicted RNase H-like HicB family nuclease
VTAIFSNGLKTIYDANFEIALSSGNSREETVLVGDREFIAILTSDLEEGGYTVKCKQIPAAISQGETIQDALDNIADAIQLCLEAEAELTSSRVRAR